MIYKAGYVLPLDGQIIENGEVLVAGGEIQAVGERLSASHPDEKVRDLGGCVLMPGFVNAHSHIDYTFSRNAADALNLWDWIERVGFNKNRQPEYETLLKAAEHGARELARSGVTCLGDSTFSGAAAEAMANIGLRGIAYKEIFGQSMGDNYPTRFTAALNDAAELQDRMPDRVRIGISPHSIYTSSCGLLELCANDCHIPIAIHLAETSAETDYSMHGTGPIADYRRRLGYEPMVTGMIPTRYLADIGLLRTGVCLAHCVHLDERETEMIAASGAGVAHCPRSNAYLGAGIAPVTALMSSGAKLGLGTDGIGTCMRFDFFEEMRFALGVHRAAARDAGVITARRVLEMATIGGARALELDSEIGTLEPGKRADMIAIDMSDMLSDEDIYLAILSRSPEDVKLIMVDGVELKQ